MSTERGAFVVSISIAILNMEIIIMSCHIFNWHDKNLMSYRRVSLLQKYIIYMFEFSI
jgi:hypothetical protein